MASRHGFEEAQTAFVGFAETPVISQIRRFGPFGPACEVRDAAGASEVRIVVLQSSEQLTDPVADLLADPIAETVP